MFNPMKYRVPILKRLMPSVRKRMARCFAANGFSLRRRNGVVMLLNTDNFVDRQIAFYGDFEGEQMSFLFSRMAEQGCDIFVDVGANIGLYSLQVAHRGLAPSILAFEPDERNRLQLGANLLVNGLAGRVRVHAQAVSSRPGSITFRPAADSSTGQSKVVAEGNGIVVGCTTLDDVLTGSGQRIFIKMDIEGHESAAIDGMAACARRNRVFLQVECFRDNIGPLTEKLSALGLRHVHQIGDDHYFSNFSEKAPHSA